MFKRNMIILLIIVLSVAAVSASYAVPRDPSGAVMDINHSVIPFWQGGYSRALADYVSTKTLGGWGCNIYGGHGVYSSCKNPNANWYGPTVGAKGCSITALTMLFWYHGITSMPSNQVPVGSPGFEGPVDPGKLDDWLVDNSGYNAAHDVHWWSSTGRFSKPVDWLDFNNGSFFRMTANKFVVPNYCCDENCSQKKDACFIISQATSTDFTEYLDKDTKNYTPNIMKMKWRKNRNDDWHNPHFAVVGGYDKADAEYRDYDPGRYYWSAEGFNKMIA